MAAVIQKRHRGFFQTQKQQNKMNRTIVVLDK